jgi:hypothetical protein
MAITVASVSSKTLQQKYILKYYLHGLRGKQGEKIPQRLCYINAAKFVIPDRALPLTEEGEGRN